MNPLLKIDFQRNRRGQTTEIARATDTGLPPFARSLYSYLANGQTAGIQHKNGAGASLLEDLYRYDPQGLMSGRDHAGNSATYSYNRNGELTGANNTIHPDESFSYDANGNRTGGQYVVGPNNRLLEDASSIYTYDDEGNRVEKRAKDGGGVTTYEYDHENHLVRATVIAAAGATPTVVEFVYDVRGRRISKRVNGATIFRTVYHGDNAWLDFGASDGDTTRYLFGDGIDELLGSACERRREMYPNVAV
jgi:YD repeat-containing protein